MEYLKLGIATILPVLFSTALYLANKKTSFGNLDEKIKQLIYGVVFGLLAIIGTECGIPINGAQINCRDASVLCAGLLFGAPAGLIAGVIGGVERWFAVYWGVGEFTRVACTVSTMLAGVYSAVLRKFMFEDKKPSWSLAFAIGVVMEVFHITMVFITNMDEPTQAMSVVKACTVPMVVSNAVALTLATVVISLFSKDHTYKKPSKVRISQTVQRWLLVTVVIAFVATSYFVFSLQQTIANVQTDSLLTLALDEMGDDINDAIERQENIDQSIVNVTKNRHVGETGYLLVVKFDGESYQLVSAPKDLNLENLESDFAQISIPEENQTFTITLNNEENFGRYTVVDDYVVLSVLPSSEALQMFYISLYVNTFMEILVFAVLFALIYMLIKRVVVDQIKSINGSLAKISNGNLNEVVNVRTNEEFASLSDDINTTVDTLKNYIAEASARIDQELEFAKNIQTSALPQVEKIFAKRKDFDVYAMTNPAKEVGGDFYDCYVTPNGALNFLIADVSGKGIPAAMFMMRAKTELKSLTEAELPLDQVFTHGNNALCEGNDAGMFVTAWQASVSLDDGTLTYANAGHNPPLIRRADGKFEFLRSKSGFILAGMEDTVYRSQQLTLNKNDVVFLYTDGVTEATDKNNNLFGEQRLLDALNSCKANYTMKHVCQVVQNAVNDFVGDNEQFDDITMVAFRYVGTLSESITFDNATISDVTRATEFVETQLEKLNCPQKAVVQIDVAIDEIFSNIVNHGYGGQGYVKVSVSSKEDESAVYVRFEDRGVPYNPLYASTPDITLSAEEREIGGLGIYMVRKTMDDVRYKYENEKNILTIKKIIG